MGGIQFAYYITNVIRFRVVLRSRLFRQRARGILFPIYLSTTFHV